MAEGGVTDQVADVVETVGEEVEEMAEAIRSLNQVKLKYAALGATFGAAAGAMVGFAVAYKRASVKYEKIAQDEISQMREHYREKTVAAEPKPDLSEVVVELGYAAERASMAEEQKPPVVPPFIEVEVTKETEEETEAVEESEAKNVFDENQRGLSTDVWNYDRELAARTPDKPYIIHKEEFSQGNFQGEPHEQATLTYFVQDDVLCDERDQINPDVDETVGLENLEKFGHGSEDANVVYIRNHTLKIDFEILRSGGSYAAEVHGVGDELQHSETRHRRPQRGYVDD